jgi:hypothetical protein
MMTTCIGSGAWVRIALLCVWRKEEGLVKGPSIKGPGGGERERAGARPLDEPRWRRNRRRGFFWMFQHAVIVKSCYEGLENGGGHTQNNTGQQGLRPTSDRKKETEAGAKAGRALEPRQKKKRGQWRAGALLVLLLLLLFFKGRVVVVV